MKNKNLVFLCIGVLFIFFVFILKFSVSQNRGIGEQNGYYWKESSSSFKTGYVVGFMEGVNTSIQEFGLAYYGGEDSSFTKGAWKLYKDLYEISFKPCELLGISVGQLCDGLDSIYTNYKNIHIPIHKAIYVAYMEITGTNQDEIAKTLELLRKNPDQIKNKELLYYFLYFSKYKPKEFEFEKYLKK